jgi:hypothetical protein
MFNILSLKRNGDQNNIRILPSPVRMANFKKVNKKASQDPREKKLWHTAGENKN